MSAKIVAHRGAGLWAPENTFAAADLALEMGASIIELDVRESLDGVLYVMHDQTVDRTTDGSGPIQLLTAAEIDALDAGRWFAPEFEGARVPRLDAFLDRLRGRAGAYVEIKWCDPGRAAAVIREAGLGEVMTFSFKAEMREGMRAAAPELMHMITLGMARNISVAKALYGVSVLEIEPPEYRPEVVEVARASGLQVMAYYEGDDEAVFQTALGLGVDYVNLDHIDVCARVMAEAGAKGD